MFLGFIVFEMCDFNFIMNPYWCWFNAVIAQLVERILGKDEVASSNLANSSITQTCVTKNTLIGCKKRTWVEEYRHKAISGLIERVNPPEVFVCSSNLIWVSTESANGEVCKTSATGIVGSTPTWPTNWSFNSFSVKKNKEFGDATTAYWIIGRPRSVNEESVG